MVVCYLEDDVVLGTTPKKIDGLGYQMLRMVKIKCSERPPNFRYIEVNRLEDHNIELKKSSLIKNLIKDYEIQDLKRIRLPTNLDIIDNDLQVGEKRFDEGHHMYRSVVGCSAYMGTQLCPDLALNASVLEPCTATRLHTHFIDDIELPNWPATR